jgi:hypothetical protein
MSELKSTRSPWTPARPEAGAAARRVALAAVLLVGCLLGGLALADTQRGGPAVGVLRFAATIDGTTAPPGGRVGRSCTFWTCGRRPAC